MGVGELGKSLEDDAAGNDRLRAGCRPRTCDLTVRRQGSRRREVCRIEQAAHGADTVGRDVAKPGVLADHELVGRVVDAVDFVIRDVAVDPLYLRSSWRSTASEVSEASRISSSVSLPAPDKSRSMTNLGMVFLSAWKYCPHYAPATRASQAFESTRVRLASLATAKAEARRRRSFVHNRRCPLPRTAGLHSSR